MPLNIDCRIFPSEIYFEQILDVGARHYVAYQLVAWSTCCLVIFCSGRNDNYSAPHFGNTKNFRLVDSRKIKFVFRDNTMFYFKFNNLSSNLPESNERLFTLTKFCTI